MDNNELVSKFAPDLTKFFATELDEARQQNENLRKENDDLRERISRFSEGKVDIFSDIASSNEDGDGEVEKDPDDLFDKLVRTRRRLAGSNKEVQDLTYANEQLERENARLRAENDTLRSSCDKDEQDELNQGENSSSASSSSDEGEPTTPLKSVKRVRWRDESTENEVKAERDETSVPARVSKRRSEDNLEGVRKKQNAGDDARHGSVQNQADCESHSPNVGAPSTCRPSLSSTPDYPGAQESEVRRARSVPEDVRDEPDPKNLSRRVGYGKTLPNLLEDIKRYFPDSTRREVLYTPDTTVYAFDDCFDHVRIVAPSTTCHPSASGFTWELKPSKLTRIAIGDAVELFDDRSFGSCYMGVYKCSGNGCLTRKQFQGLPEKVREALLTKTFPNRRRVSPSDRKTVRSLYATGTRIARYIDFDRDSFNGELYDAFQKLKKDLEGMR